MQPSPPAPLPKGEGRRLQTHRHIFFASANRIRAANHPAGGPGTVAQYGLHPEAKLGERPMVFDDLEQVGRIRSREGRGARTGFARSTRRGSPRGCRPTDRPPRCGRRIERCDVPAGYRANSSSSSRLFDSSVASGPE